MKIKWDLDDDSIFTNVVWYTTLIKERVKSHDNHKRFRKSFWQKSTSFYKKKKLNKVGIKGTYVNTAKAMYDKLRANIMLNCEKLKDILPRSETRKERPFITIYISHSFGNPSHSK